MISGSTRATDPTISLCLIARNEERYIDRCLASVQGVVDEIVVVDTGSEDRTLDIVERHRASVFHFPWRNDFSLARNSALERASGEWVLFLDADEELDAGSRSRLRGTLACSAADGLTMRVRSFSPAGDLVQYQDDSLTRLFKNRPEYRYEQPIHEQIRPSIERHGGTIQESGLLVLHHGYADPAAQGGSSRATRNLRLLQKALEASPSDPYLLYQLGVTYKSLGNSTDAYRALCKVLALDHSCLASSTLDTLRMKMAQLALAADDFPATVVHAEASLALNPDNGVSLYLLALAFMFQGHIANAYPIFKRLRRNPAANLVEVKELDEVIEYCASALEVSLSPPR